MLAIDVEATTVGQRRRERDVKDFNEDAKDNRELIGERKRVKPLSRSSSRTTLSDVGRCGDETVDDAEEAEH